MTNTTITDTMAPLPVCPCPLCEADDGREMFGRICRQCAETEIAEKRAAQDARYAQAQAQAERVRVRDEALAVVQASWPRRTQCLCGASIAMDSKAVNGACRACHDEQIERRRTSGR